MAGLAFRSLQRQEMEKSLDILRLQSLLSASEFESLIEPRNVPAVFSGSVKDWKAISKWNPSNGGLDYLKERVGLCNVEAMLSRSAPVFYGDIRSHERVSLQFSSFIDSCDQLLRKKDDSSVVSGDLDTNGITGVESDAGHFPSELTSIFLAQVAIWSDKNYEKVQLEPLMEDIQTPAFLESKELVSINLWMNCAQCRSSTHYDPHHNILCVVSGCKQVLLWPPSATPMLYPMHIYGEASNHSSIALENPDYSTYPRARSSIEYAHKVILNAGDALFIPEGWFHQVDSDDLTIAVNFWWQSSMVSNMLEHMDAYYLRILLRRLMDKEMNQVLPEASGSTASKMKTNTPKRPSDEGKDSKVDDFSQPREEEDLKETELFQKPALEDLSPSALHALHGLISVVHNHVSVVNQSHQLESTSTNESASIITKDEVTNKKKYLFCLDDDEIATIIWKMEPRILQSVLHSMAHNFPRTLEALIMHLLSPVGAEVLTRKFDEMDKITPERDRARFYEFLYGAFDDRFAAMDIILNGKELFALQVYKSILSKYLGVNLDGPN